MSKRLEHRGPDEQGTWWDQQQGVGLPAAAAFAANAKPADQAFRLSVLLDDEDGLEVVYEVAANDARCGIGEWEHH